MVAEVSIVVKNQEKRQTHKHLVYESFACHEDDVYLKSLIQEALKQFNEEPDDVKIKISITVK